LKRKPLLTTLSELFPDIAKETLYARVMCGEVTVDGERIRDPKAHVYPGASISFEPKRFVSRGGVKLDFALGKSDFDVRNKTVLDAGASTGGFSDCLLRHGASLVHAVDVGINQLAYSLRIDPRVIVHERTNIMSAHGFEPKPEIAVADLSFRSLRRAAARILNFTTEKRALVLAKPQFEWPKNDTSFRGVATDTSATRTVLIRLAIDLSGENVHVCEVIQSPITGRKGNREFFLRIEERETPGQPLDQRKVEGLVDEALSDQRDSLDSGSPI
jgi:23S rRNA (cytidine1920-2'-O)/16S rRNA (cytidine1409-2'-O)-methyltransferase